MFECKIVNIFFTISFNILFGYLKELSHLGFLLSIHIICFG